MLAQQFHSIEQMQQGIARRRRPPTRGSVLPTSVIQTPQQPHDAKGTSLEPSTDGFMVREAWQVVGAHVQCLSSDVPHRKNCGKYVPGAPKDGRPCACKWWDAKITQDNKSHGFAVNYTKNDINEGWGEHGVDILRLRRTELGPEPANGDAVARNLTEEVELAATTRKWETYWSCDWLEAHAPGAQWPRGVEQGMWGEPTVCPLWQRFLDTPLDEVLAMLRLRPEWAKDDGHCQEGIRPARMQEQAKKQVRHTGRKGSQETKEEGGTKALRPCLHGRHRTGERSLLHIPGVEL